MIACRKKEAELLEFTQKLTETNVTLQSECAFTEGRASALESEHTRITNKGLLFMTSLTYAKEIFRTVQCDHKTRIDFFEIQELYM